MTNGIYEVPSEGIWINQINSYKTISIFGRHSGHGIQQVTEDDKKDIEYIEDLNSKHNQISSSNPGNSYAMWTSRAQ
ncbi:hypothetical protein AYI68_g3780 [Smittium mucronatum]|uniref:Uncharacterized protein n=1 Tax=Smittium mucronatum TaxID=133383 RepID=A0A1R0GYY9_9FUNG|nr:hypothetical protein AYI68_g3780 [Smittium mucronatum]